MLTVLLDESSSAPSCRPLPSASRVLSNVDGGEIRAVDVGDEVLIRLSGNAPTGFRWERTAPIAFAGTPLEPVREGRHRSLGSTLGRPGLFSFRYSAVRQGRSR